MTDSYYRNCVGSRRECRNCGALFTSLFDGHDWCGRVCEGALFQRRTETQEHARNKRRLRASALAKLTIDERKALGVGVWP